MDFYRFDSSGNLEVRRGVHAVDSPAYFRDGWSQTPPETPAIDVKPIPETAIAPTPAIASNPVETPLPLEALALEQPQPEPEAPKPRRTRKPAIEG